MGGPAFRGGNYSQSTLVYPMRFPAILLLALVGLAAANDNDANDNDLIEALLRLAPSSDLLQHIPNIGKISNHAAVAKDGADAAVVKDRADAVKVISCLPDFVKRVLLLLADIFSAVHQNTSVFFPTQLFFF
jgi:hypothetical protein